MWKGRVRKHREKKTIWIVPSVMRSTGKDQSQPADRTGPHRRRPTFHRLFVQRPILPRMCHFLHFLRIFLLLLRCWHM